jgi:hypothetical protein
MWRVITAPNSAFAQVRDNEERYFVQSIGLMILVSVLSVLVVLPFIMIPLDDTYFEGMENMTDLPTDSSDLVLTAGSSILNSIVSFVLFYFIGKKLGGNTHWKKVFSVIFHTYIPAIPMLIVISILVFLMWDSMAAIDPSYLMNLDEDTDEEQFLSIVGPMLGYVGLIALAAIAFMVWVFVVAVKAVKILNGFSTAKAFGLIILVMIIASIVTAPITM